LVASAARFPRTYGFSGHRAFLSTASVDTDPAIIVGRRDEPYPFDDPLFSRENDPPRGYLDPNRRKKVIIPFEERPEFVEENTIEVPVTTFTREEKGTIKLNHKVFDAPVRTDIIHRVITWQLARRRAGNASAKDRAQVRYSSKKIRRQKKLGMARLGNRAVPQLRKGGKAHGPHPRSYEYSLPTKVRKLGMRAILTAKLKEGKLVVLEEATFTSHKTKELNSVLEANKWPKSILLFAAKPDNHLFTACNNLHWFTAKLQQQIDVYSISKHDTLVLSKDCINYITQRYRPDS